MASATSPALGGIDTPIEPPDEETQEAPQAAPPDPQRQPWVELLQADTPREEVHQRQMFGKGGQPVTDAQGNAVTLDYVTARFVQDRLDSAVGPINWQSIFNVLPSGAVQCGLGIRIPGSEPAEWVWKWDVGTPSTIEPEKGAHSDAFKRAAVQWGIARDLYDTRDEARLVPEPRFAQTQQPQAQPSADPTRVPMQQRVQEATGATGYVEGGAAEWVCPIHDDSKIVPAGVSRRTGKAYKAFWACPVAGCDQKGGYVKGQ
jgi:hypothetical protein